MPSADLFPAAGRRALITCRELKKNFKKIEAVRGISFDVYEEELFGFLGPNGAGKTTTMNMLATLLTPSSGDAIVAGHSISMDRDGVRRSIGMVFQDPSLDDRLTAEENLRFHAQLYGVSPADYRRRSEEVLRLVELWDRRFDIVKTFSGGMRRRLEIARGLIHHPQVLFLDEPTLGLDPQTRAHLWDYLLKLKKERHMTIFLTTHQMNEAEYCDRICVIDHGQIVALDTPAKLKKLVGDDVISVRPKDPSRVKAELDRIFQQVKYVEDGAYLHLRVSDGHTFLPILLTALPGEIESVTLREPTLDDVFLHLTGRSFRDEPETSKMSRGFRGHRH